MPENFDSPEFEVEDEAFEEEEFETEPNPLEGDMRAITIRNTSGSEIIPWREGMTLADAIQAGNLVLRAQADFYLDDVAISMDTVLPAGAVVTAIGASQKGG